MYLKAFSLEISTLKGLRYDMVAWIIAYFLPIIIGLTIPFLLTLNQKWDTTWPVRTLWRSRAIGLIISLSLILGLINLFTPSTSRLLTTANFFCLMFFLLGFGLLIMAIFYLLTSVGLSGALSQLITSLVALLMNTTVFYANPLIETYQSNPDTFVSGQTITNLVVNLNPMIIIASNFFGHDLLRAPTLYATSAISYYSYAVWTKVFLWYIVIAVIFLVAGIFIRRLSRMK